MSSGLNEDYETLRGDGLSQEQKRQYEAQALAQECLRQAAVYSKDRNRNPTKAKEWTEAAQSAMAIVRECREIDYLEHKRVLGR